MKSCTDCRRFRPDGFQDGVRTWGCVWYSWCKGGRTPGGWPKVRNYSAVYFQPDDTKQGQWEAVTQGMER